MKKIFSLLVVVVAAAQFAFAGDVITKDAMKLPLTARNFISQHFSKSPIAHIKIDSEMLQSRKYEVKLVNGAEVDFDSKGNWVEVDCKKAAVPESVVPAFVKQYMKSNGFQSEFVTKIDRDRKGYEAELNSGLDMKFSKSGKFRQTDR